MTAPRFPLQGDPFALRVVDPRMAQFMSLAEDPAAAVVASAPAGMDSILRPRQPSAGILTPEDQASIKRNALLHIAAGLLQAGGRSPNQRGTLANIGSVLEGIDLPGATMSALRMRAAVDKLNQESNARTALQDITARHPAMPGEDREQKFSRLTDIVTEAAAVPGLEDWIGKMSNVLAQLRPPKQGRLIPSVEIVNGVPTRLFRDPETGEVVKEGGEVQGLTEYQIQQLQLQRNAADRADTSELKAASIGANMASSHLAMKAIEDTDPQAVEEVAAVVRGGRVAGAVPVVGPLLDEAIRAGKAPALSPAARQLLANLNSFVAAAVPLRGGQALTFIEVKLFMDEFVRDPGDDSQTAAVKLESRLRRIKESKVQGRRAWDDALSVFHLTDAQIFGADQPAARPPAANSKPRTGWRALNPEGHP